MVDEHSRRPRGEVMDAAWLLPLMPEIRNGMSVVWCTRRLKGRSGTCLMDPGCCASRLSAMLSARGWSKLLRSVNRALVDFLCWQVHFLEEIAISSIVAHIFEERIAFDLRHSGISLFVSTPQPLK